MPESDSLKYSQAMQRLESILEKIDDSSVGIDELAAQVQEAATLLKSCRRMLLDTEKAVGEALRGMDEGSEEIN